jgi:hypothetical protein
MNTGDTSSNSAVVPAARPPDHSHQDRPARRISAYTPVRNSAPITTPRTRPIAPWARKSPSGWLLRP